MEGSTVEERSAAFLFFDDLVAAREREHTPVPQPHRLVTGPHTTAVECKNLRSALLHFEEAGKKSRHKT